MIKEERKKSITNILNPVQHGDSGPIFDEYALNPARSRSYLPAFRSLDLIILFCAAAIPFARSLFWGAAILDDDVFLQSLPSWEWLVKTLQNGDSLLWAPEILGGFPIAFTQYPFLYPPDLLLAILLPPTHAYAWSLVLHIWFAGVLTYLYCRLLGLGSSASLLAALSYQLSSEVIAGSSGFAAHSAFVLPGFLWAFELVLRRGWRYGPPFALILAAALLGGHPQLVLISLSAGSVYGIFRLLISVCKVGFINTAGIALIASFAGSIGISIAAVRLLPTLDVLAFSTRSAALPMEASNAGALSLQGLIVGYLVPLSRLQELPWGAPGYAGPAAIILATFGMRWMPAQSLWCFFVVLGSLAAGLSLGDATPLSIITRLPFFSLFRETSRITLVTTFCVAVIAGLSLDRFAYLIKLNDRVPSRLPTVLAILLGLFVLGSFIIGLVFQFGSGALVEDLRTWVQLHQIDALNPIRPRMSLALAGLLISAFALAAAVNGRLSLTQLNTMLVISTFGVMVPLASILNPTISPEVVGKTPKTAIFLEKNGELGRIFSHRPGMRLYNHMHYYGPGPEAGFGDDLRYRFQAEMLAPILNLRWKIASADGYEQLHSRYQDILLRYIDSERVSEWIETPGKWAHLNMEQRLRVLNMLGVKYIVSAVDLSAEAPELKVVASDEVAPGAISRAPIPVFLLKNPGALPRFYLVPKAELVSSDIDFLDAVALGKMSPTSAVFLSKEDLDTGSKTIPSVGAEHPDLVKPHTLRSNETVFGISNDGIYRNDQIWLKVTTDRPAYLVTNDSYWPGWHAFVDGKEVPVLRANVNGRAIWIEEAGVHLIHFQFVPQGFSQGLIASISASVLCAIWLGLSIYYRRRVVR